MDSLTHGSSTVVIQREDQDGRRHSPRRKHFCSWVATDAKQLERAERLLLRSLSYTNAIIAGLNTISTDDISWYDDALAEGEVGIGKSSTLPRAGVSRSEDALTSSCEHGAAASDSREILVLVHGFAGGVGFWAQNWEYFAQRYRVYAIDLPGFARSERRPTRVETLADSMGVMTEYLERWYLRLGFDKKVILVGHSFGSFICAHFAMRFPAFVKQLIMTEPWGINQANPARIKALPVVVRLLVRVFQVSNPLSILRGLGPAGPSVMRRARPDFGRSWAGFLEDVNVLYDYLYHCNARSPAVGERLFRACYHCDMASKVPLPEVLPDCLSRDIPVGLLFGATSWIAPGEALGMAELMRQKGFAVHTDSVENAGHQIFTDNAASFNEKVSTMIETLMGAVGAPTGMAVEPSQEMSSQSLFSPRSQGQ